MASAARHGWGGGAPSWYVASTSVGVEAAVVVGLLAVVASRLAGVDVDGPSLAVALVATTAGYLLDRLLDVGSLALRPRGGSPLGWTPHHALVGVHRVRATWLASVLVVAITIGGTALPTGAWPWAAACTLLAVVTVACARRWSSASVEMSLAHALLVAATLVATSWLPTLASAARSGSDAGWTDVGTTGSLIVIGALLVVASNVIATTLVDHGLDDRRGTPRSKAGLARARRPIAVAEAAIVVTVAWLAWALSAAGAGTHPTWSGWALPASAAWGLSVASVARRRVVAAWLARWLVDLGTIVAIGTVAVSLAR